MQCLLETEMRLDSAKFIVIKVISMDVHSSWIHNWSYFIPF